MALTRKKYVVDKKFQFGISLKAIIPPLITTLVISGLLLYFADRNNQLIEKNNKRIDSIIDNQSAMIDMFLSTPSLQYTNNPVIKQGVASFKDNIGNLKTITDNSRLITSNGKIVFNILVVMTVVQTAIIFAMFIFFSHKISGPVEVMRKYMRHLREGKDVKFRPLRKNDHLQDFYNEFRDTIDQICGKDKK